MKEGIKHDQEKIRWDLVQDDQIEKIAEILTFGAQKYTDNNWQQVTPFKERYYAAFMRHMKAWRRGEKYDIGEGGSGKTHLAHAATCLHFLMWGEDNLWNLENLNIGLDIDGVVADFNTAISERYGTPPGNWWKYSYIFSGKDAIWNEIGDDEEFWMSLKPLVDPNDIPFEPKCYITARKQVDWTKKWLELNGFPCKPVYSTFGTSKMETLIKEEIDVFIDDKPDNYYEIKKSHIKIFLMNQPWNERYNVGNDRIFSLKELKDKL